MKNIKVKKIFLLLTLFLAPLIQQNSLQAAESTERQRARENFEQAEAKYVLKKKGYDALNTQAMQAYHAAVRDLDLKRLALVQAKEADEEALGLLTERLAWTADETMIKNKNQLKKEAQEAKKATADALAAAKLAETESQEALDQAMSNVDEDSVEREKLFNALEEAKKKLESKIEKKDRFQKKLEKIIEDEQEELDDEDDDADEIDEEPNAELSTIQKGRIFVGITLTIGVIALSIKKLIYDVKVKKLKKEKVDISDMTIFEILRS